MQALSAVTRHAHWLLRIALASVFLYHGLTKFPQLGGMAEMMGMPIVVLVVVAILETIGGVLILVGGVFSDILTRIGGLLMVPVMLGAIAMVHWPQWSFAPSETNPMGGMEFQVTLTLLALYFVIKGNGANFGVYEPQSR